jgi:hypothetical protein
MFRLRGATLNTNGFPGLLHQPAGGATALVLSISLIIRTSTGLQWTGTLLLNNIYNRDLPEQ